MFWRKKSDTPNLTKRELELLERAKEALVYMTVQQMAIERFSRKLKEYGERLTDLEIKVDHSESARWQELDSLREELKGQQAPVLFPSMEPET